MTDDFEEERSGRKARRTEQELRRDHERLHERYEQLTREHQALLVLDNHTHRPVEINSTTSSGTSEATAVVLASDFHVEEVVRSSTVNGKNRYSPVIARERAKMFFQRVLRMVQKERQDVVINNLILWLGGDFITNSIHEEMPENNAMRPMDAMLFATDILTSGIQFLLDNSDLTLTIPCSVGNHSRTTRVTFVGSERGNSLEWMMYHYMAKHFKGESRVRFIIEDAYLTYVKVYGYTIRFHHGHAMRYQGGVGGIHIPLNKALAQWDKTRQADVTCCGHWHQYTPSRRYIVNGSLIGYSAFAVWIKAEYEPPMQAFFLVDKKRGVTVQIPILV